MIHLPRNPTLLPNNFHTLSEGKYSTVMFEEEAGDQTLLNSFAKNNIQGLIMVIFKAKWNPQQPY